MTEPRNISGQDINVAAAATRAILDTLLDREGVTFAQYVALRALVGLGEPSTRAAVAQRAAGPASPEPMIRQAVDELEAAGLVSADPADPHRVVPTPTGQELFERVFTASARAGDEVFDGVAGQDLVAAKRVLDHVTRRAAEVRAGL
jgi:DNA-binding MarR family transcriptional regulator